MRTLVNSEGPDEMPLYAAFHQGLHYLLRKKLSSEKEIQFLFGNYNLKPLDIYNGPSQVYYIKPEGRVYQSIKGKQLTSCHIQNQQQPLRVVSLPPLSNVAQIDENCFSVNKNMYTKIALPNNSYYQN